MRSQIQGMTIRPRRWLAALLLVATPLAAAPATAHGQRATGQRTAETPERPALVVLITIDQFRADYLDRFGGQLTGGLARLLANGAVFTNAHQDHAITETAPGHATLLSGRHPRSTGIMLNRVGVEDDKSPLVDGGIGDGASPVRFVGTTLVDWLRARDRGTRVVSVSMKDRGAILPIGRTPADVYWYSADGRFVTSSYYAGALPGWVKSFNARMLPQGYAGQRWSLLLPDSAYRERDSVSVEAAGQGIAFPHDLPADAAGAASLVRITPFIDDVTIAFALHALSERALGADGGNRPRTDVLAISLSATDVIGHRYGPDSREMHDQVLRVDRTIGRFLDSLYAVRDSSRVLVALTSDHGVATIPEVAAMTEPTPSPMPQRVQLYDLLPAVRAKMREAKVDTAAIDVDEQILLLDRAAFRKSALDPDSLVDWFAREARNVPGVLRVDRFRQLVADSAKDTIARRWSHQFPATSRIELVVTLAPGSTWGGNVASHGSPHAYDSHIPLIIAGAGVRRGRYADFVRTVDLAPTLAALAGVKPSEQVDGVVLNASLSVKPNAKLDAKQ